MFLNTISMSWHPDCEVLKLAKNIVSAQCCGASELQKYNIKGMIFFISFFYFVFVGVYFTVNIATLLRITDFTQGDE